MLRRALTGVPPVEAMELVLNKLKKTKSNIEFLLGMAVGYPIEIIYPPGGGFKISRPFLFPLKRA